MKTATEKEEVKVPDWSNVYSSKNYEGYHDPTASGAFDSIDRSSSGEDRLRRFIATVKNMAYLADFEITNRIELRDRRTGKVYR